MSEVVKAIVDKLFAELEQKFAHRPALLLAAHAFHAIALDLLPLLVASAEAQAPKTAATAGGTTIGVYRE